MSDRVDFRLLSSDGRSLAGYEWPVESPRAAVVLVHGMAEHALRYDRFAQALNQRGIAVVTMDLRGHGHSAVGSIRGFFANRDGWRVVLKDLDLLTQWTQTRYEGLPLLLFGHSMGSIFARLMLQNGKGTFRAAVLSGVTVDKPGRRDIAPALTAVVAAVQGAATPSKFLDNMVFGAYHKPFVAERPAFGWLSRDQAEVDAYVSDANCGFVCTASLFRDVAQALKLSLRADQVVRMSAATPILIISGSRDPAGEYGAAAKELDTQYRKAGLTVTTRIYDQGRHELLNDICRDKATEDILKFYDGTLN